MKKKTVKLVSAVVVLGVLCAAYEGVNFYVTSQEENSHQIFLSSYHLFYQILLHSGLR